MTSYKFRSAFLGLVPIFRNGGLDATITWMEGAVAEILDHVKSTHCPVLNLSHRELKVVPAEISELTFLKVLLLNDNGILLPPAEIASLHCLERLSLEGNALTLLPPGIQSLRRISFLNLSRNNLCCLPPAVSQLGSLTELWLADVGLDGVPPEINGLTNLEVLSLSDNRIAHLPREFCASMSRLRWLALGRNQLASLDASVAKLVSLRAIVLDGNDFSEFPQVLLSVKNLQSVSLRRNRIDCVSAALGDLLVSSAHFSRLDLRENRLCEQARLGPPWSQLDFVFVE